MKQKIRYDNAAILQQAQNYTDPYRVIDEYIDNSIDAAEDDFDPSLNMYTEDKLIKVTKKGGVSKEKSLTIEDNCSGIKIRRNKPLTIFRSNKRNDPRTNGWYGQGEFSGFALGKKISVKTKVSCSRSIHKYEFTPDIFKKAKQGDMEIEIHSTQANKHDNSSGTTIVISDFYPGVFDELSMQQLRKEIEKHFESILRRNRIKIVLTDTDGSTVECKAFEYEKYCDNPYRKIITTLYKTNSKKYKTLKAYDISDTPVEIFLILSEDRELNREPAVISKGRRINELWKLEQFRTNYRSSIWNNPVVSGYVSAPPGVLVPTPTRKDFKSTELSKAFLYTLNMHEKEIKEYLNKKSSITVSKQFGKLEDKVNPVLKKFINEEIIGSGFMNDEINNEQVKEYKLLGYRIKETAGTEPEHKLKPDRKQEQKIIPNNSKGNKAENTNIRNKRERNHPFKVQLPSKSQADNSITLKIDSTNEPYKDYEGNPLRSVTRDSNIIVFQKHPEFRKRLVPSAKGYIEINDKIIHYLAMEIITQIKNATKTYSWHIHNQEKVFQEFVSSVLKLEDELKVLSGERI